MTGSDVTRAEGFVLADRDGDGDRDVVARVDGEAVVVYDNGGTGLFRAQRVVELPGLRALAVADLDGDGSGEVIGGVEPVQWWAHEAEVEVCVADTDPAAFDTDGGGVGDGDELGRFTDPLDPRPIAPTVGAPRRTPGAQRPTGRW